MLSSQQLQKVIKQQGFFMFFFEKQRIGVSIRLRMFRIKKTIQKS